VSFLLAAINGRAAQGSADVALEDHTGRALGWGDLARAIIEQQQYLRRRLAFIGRPVAVQAGQGIAQCIADLALMEMGVPVVSLPTYFSPAQTAHALAESGAQALLRDAGTERRLDLMICREAVAELPQRTARISYTSGSTDRPRGLCLSASHLYMVAQAVVARVGPAQAGRHLAVLPPGLLLEVVAGCHATLLAGGTYLAWSAEEVGLQNPFQPDLQRLVAAVARARARSMILVPEYLAGLVACLEASGMRLPSLGLVAVGGARVAPQLLERAAAVGLPVRQGYGLTECGSVVTLDDGDPSGRGSAGTSLGAHAVTLDGDGEILINGPMYLGTVGATRPSGPLRTGDLGRIDAAGRLWIEGRKSNLIVTSFGRNVSPEWPESLLAAQPAIAQCLVHGDGLPMPEALIVPRGSPVEVDAAIARVNAQLPEYAHIARWRAVAPFTVANGLLTGNGRLRRAAISRRFLSTESMHAVL
jgi:long-subunit acyl-CoA synthetase (AMP-forming)